MIDIINQDDLVLSHYMLVLTKRVGWSMMYHTNAGLILGNFDGNYSHDIFGIAIIIFNTLKVSTKLDK
jgi:hypothetical protein